MSRVLPFFNLGPDANAVADNLAQRQLSLANLARAGQIQQTQLDDQTKARQKDDALLEAWQTSGGDLEKFAQLSAPIDVEVSAKARTAHQAALEKQKAEAETKRQTDLGLRNKRLSSLLSMPPEQRARVYAQAAPDIAAALGRTPAELPGTYQEFEAEGIPGLQVAIGQTPETLPAEIQELRQFFPNWGSMSGDERIAGLSRIAQAKQTPAKRAQVPGTDVPFSPEVEAQKIRIAKAEAALKAAATGSTGKDDAEAIADAIINGDQPPETKGLYKLGGSVRAILARKNYDLARAQTDWTATQKHMSTLNGPQQERLRQAITFTRDSIDNIEELYAEWKKVAGQSGVKVFNRAALVAAMNLPGEAGAIATSLEAQIADLTSELGTVYKGGNSSTDHSLELASKNLSAEWNDETFQKAVGNIRKNLQIRWNSMMTSPAVGVSADSPYTPAEQAGGARGGGAAGSGSGGGGSDTTNAIRARLGLPARK